MKTKLFLLILFAGFAKLTAQIGFLENIVVGDSYTTRFPELVKAADIDGDNDLDIIAFGRGLNWYQNVDGLGNFGEKKIVAVTFGDPVWNALHPVDFDNDGDIDIFCVLNNIPTWYENTNGLGIL